MERRIRYEVLQNEEEEENNRQAPIPVEMAAVTPVESENPQENNTNQEVENQGESQANQKGVGLPPLHLPDYNTATNLPSYEEAERTKEEEEQQRQREDAERGQNMQHWRECHPGIGDDQIGTDGMFMCTFIVAFLFNWIGLLASLCISPTLAGRFGALAGFGLSMVKWVIIVKQRNWGGDFAGDTWLWWLLILLGVMIFFRGCLQYLRVKRQWKQVNHGTSHGRMYFIF